MQWVNVDFELSLTNLYNLHKPTSPPDFMPMEFGFAKQKNSNHPMAIMVE